MTASTGSQSHGSWSAWSRHAVNVRSNPSRDEIPLTVEVAAALRRLPSKTQVTPVWSFTQARVHDRVWMWTQRAPRVLLVWSAASVTLGLFAGCGVRADEVRRDDRAHFVLQALELICEMSRESRALERCRCVVGALTAIEQAWSSISSPLSWILTNTGSTAMAAMGPRCRS